MKKKRVIRFVILMFNIEDFLFYGIFNSKCFDKL